MAKRKIAVIGAGSIIFCKTLILDILATPGLEDTEFAPDGAVHAEILPGGELYPKKSSGTTA